MTVLEPPASSAILALYYLVLGALAFYGLHRFVLVWTFWRSARRRALEPPAVGEWPPVTVQLPIYNERHVATRLLDAVCALDYPREKLEIQVLDDSTDETRGLVARRVALWRARGLDVHHLHRAERRGFKAGALAAGHGRARGELIAVFDADFVPPSDFLRRAVPWLGDPAVGMVQARWTHLNREYSGLTRAQAVLLDGHFVVEHAARHASGCFFNFNGTAGVWRRRAIDEAGGWRQETLTEDLDLSYRAQLAGWRFVFLPDLVVPAELPTDSQAFKRQQFRWAKGSMQTARKLLPTLLAAPLPRAVRCEAFVHLTSNVSYLLMVALSLLLFPAMLLRRDADPRTLLLLDAPLFFGATIAVSLFYASSQLALTGDWRSALRSLPGALGLGIGLSVNNARAVVEGLRRDGGVFERTPKYRIEGRGGTRSVDNYRLRADSTVLIDGLLALYQAACVCLAGLLQMWWALPFLLLFLHGHFMMFRLAVADELGHLVRRRGLRRPLEA
jgi:cellulose synthase/poly-beta-1,6-N-acetylglucosamine synthase-like glycosyltransferase